MFEFTSMLGNYEDRKVGRENYPWGSISTAKITDSDHYEYETAVSHAEYNSAKWVIVQTYLTRDEAQVGHNEWVIRMTEETLPKELRDVANNTITGLMDYVADKPWRVFPRVVDHA